MRFNALTGELFNLFQMNSITIRSERNRNTGCASAASTTNPVNVTALWLICVAVKFACWSRLTLPLAVLTWQAFHTSLTSTCQNLPKITSTGLVVLAALAQPVFLFLSLRIVMLFI